MQAIRTHLVIMRGMILVEMKASGWYSPQTLLRVEQIDGDDLPAPRRTGSQISGALISSASKKPSILSGTSQGEAHDPRRISRSTYVNHDAGWVRLESALEVLP